MATLKLDTEEKHIKNGKSRGGCRREANPQVLHGLEPMKLALKPENIVQFVYFIRGEKVMLAQDLAQLYGVPVRVLNQAVKRNIKRFPADFMFQITKKEFEALKSQIVISSRDDPHLRSQTVTSSWGGLRRALPYAFTEQGVAMLSSVLRSKRAIEVNIAIMRTFVQLRRLMDTNRDLARKIEALEKKYDEHFAEVFAAIKQLIAPPVPPKRQIGFHP
jgi:ORF6N domain